jgi:hypothetical protein
MRRAHPASGRGGIFNGMLFGGPLSPVTLTNTQVTQNSLVVSSGLTARGGGLFSCGFPFTLAKSAMFGNSPDQIAVCPPTPFAGVAQALQRRQEEGDRVPPYGR